MAPAGEGQLAANRFLSKTEENADFNQYWYSNLTIDALVKACTVDAPTEDDAAKPPIRAAFLSTPSLYHSLPVKARKSCALLDLDPEVKGSCPEEKFYAYDFNKPDEIPAHFHRAFDLIVIDPPFITHEVWEKYAAAVAVLGDPSSPYCTAEGGVRVLGTTVAENANLMKRLFGATSQKFKPSIPHLVYQYDTYANYPCQPLDAANPEIPED